MFWNQPDVSHQSDLRSGARFPSLRRLLSLVIILKQSPLILKLARLFSPLRRPRWVGMSVSLSGIAQEQCDITSVETDKNFRMPKRSFNKNCSRNLSEFPEDPEVDTNLEAFADVDRAVIVLCFTISSYAGAQASEFKADGYRSAQKDQRRFLG